MAKHYIFNAAACVCVCVHVRVTDVIVVVRMHVRTDASFFFFLSHMTGHCFATHNVVRIYICHNTSCSIDTQLKTQSDGVTVPTSYLKHFPLP